MPVVFEEVVAEVVPDRAARAEPPRAEAKHAWEPEDRVVRRELRRLARRAGRLQAD
jgi:hypothetical protein